MKSKGGQSADSRDDDSKDDGELEARTTFDQALFDEQMSKCARGLSAFRTAISDAQSEVYVGTDCLGHRCVCCLLLCGFHALSMS